MTPALAGQMTRALWYQEAMAAEFERFRHPGSFRIVARGEPGLFEMIYWCPCGCGMRNSLLIGEGHKPGGARPSWRWNGSRTDPTLDPSINVDGHWHGWLQAGAWRAVQ